MTAADLIAGRAWAILPEALETIIAIAERSNEAPEAVAARLGRPLANTRRVSERDGTAVIPITGPIFRRANLFTEISGATSVEILARDIQTAAESEAVARIVLEIDSPGGEATGIAELAAQIRAVGKPVVAYVEGTAASAAYWLAAAADTVIASPTALLGSIGVVGTYRPEKDAPIRIISTQSPLKQAAPDTEAGRAEAQRIVDELAAVFVADVAAYRNTSEDAVLENFGRGSLLVGASAVAAGLADEVATFESLFTSAGRAGTHIRSSAMSAKTELPQITAQWLRENHLSVYEEIHAAAFADGELAGRESGRSAERARIEGVFAQTLPGHDELIRALAFDGVTSPEAAALRVLAAEREAVAAAREQFARETPEPVKSVSAESDQSAREKPADFEAKVAELVAAGRTRGQAMRASAQNHPELHKAWLARINRTGSEG